MKLHVVLGVVVLASGCASVPKPYDGVIGYQVASKDGATQVTYMDEARVGREKTLVKVSEVCAMDAKVSLAGVAVKITSEEEYLADVSISVPVTVGSMATGDVRNIGTSGPVNIGQPVNQSQALTRQVKVRRVEALCARVAP